jgi:hypothetical protein
MAGKKFKVQHGGAEIEVELEGVMTEAEVAEQYVAKAVHNSELAKLRKKSQGLKTPDELLEDDEFKTRAIETWGVKPGKSAADVEAARKEWDAKVLKPVTDELGKAKGAIDGLRRGSLHARLIAAAQGQVAPQFLKPPTRGAVAPFVAMLEPAFALEPETQDFYVRDGERFAYAAKPADGAPVPYKTPEEHVAEWIGNKDNAAFLIDQKQRGPNLQNTGRSSTSGVVEGKADPYAFARNAEKIAKGEVTYQK